MNELDEIKKRVDIVSFIGDYITLKKAGRNFKGLCPFHSEKSPSFIVSPDRQIWHCFGACGDGGDIFTFLMKVEGLEFPEALEILAQKAGVKLTRQYRVTEGQKLKEAILKANRYAANFYHYLLTKHQVGNKARSYLLKRKITDKIIETFTLGYAPSGWDSLVKFLRKKGVNDFVITKAGLGNKGRSGLYDRFRQRLIFALKDHRGNVIGFSGRLLPDGRESPQEAKYINTAETPVYIKGNVFYGLDVTKEAIQKKNEAIIVEGEFDFLSSFQVGVNNIVAIKGTALTVNQVNLIKRYTDTISLALDSDIAGDQAVKRGVEIAESAGLNIKVVKVPLGKDPDECIKENPALWKKAVSESLSVYDFLLQAALSKFDKKEAFGKRKIADELLPFYAKIENPIVQTHYLRLLAKTVDTPEDSLLEMVEKIKKGRKVSFFKKPDEEKGKEKLSREEYILALLLQAPSIGLLKEIINEDLASKINLYSKNPAVKKIISCYLDWLGKQTGSASEVTVFIKSLSEELIPYADKAYLLELGLLTSNEALFKQELIASVQTLMILENRRRMQEISTKLRQNDDEDNLDKLNSEFIKLKETLKQLDSKSDK